MTCRASRVPASSAVVFATAVTCGVRSASSAQGSVRTAVTLPRRRSIRSRGPQLSRLVPQAGHSPVTGRCRMPAPSRFCRRRGRPRPRECCRTRAFAPGVSYRPSHSLKLRTRSHSRPFSSNWRCAALTLTDRRRRTANRPARTVARLEDRRFATSAMPCTRVPGRVYAESAPRASNSLPRTVKSVARSRRMVAKARVPHRGHRTAAACSSAAAGWGRRLIRDSGQGFGYDARVTRNCCQGDGHPWPCIVI